MAKRTACTNYGAELGGTAVLVVVFVGDVFVAIRLIGVAANDLQRQVEFEQLGNVHEAFSLA